LLVLGRIAVDGGDLGEALEALCGFFVGGLKVLAVTAPWRVELDDLELANWC